MSHEGDYHKRATWTWPSTMAPADPSNVWLSKNVSVAKYRQLEARRDREAISKFVQHRFTERYVAPLEVEPQKKSGFALMAIACLMIEALESFSCGWSHTRQRSELAFCSFFRRWPQFSVFRPQARAFYRHVRCGILHQAETTGGWRIWRRGLLFDRTAITVNAASFMQALQIVLAEYSEKLRNEPWDSDRWKRFRKKMDAICKNAVS